MREFLVCSCRLMVLACAVNSSGIALGQFPSREELGEEIGDYMSYVGMIISGRELEFADGIEGLFLGRDRSDTSRLRFHADLNIAVYAAWFQAHFSLRDANDDTTASKEKHESLRASSVMRFLGFLEGKLNCGAPEWWVNELTRLDLGGDMVKTWNVESSTVPAFDPTGDMVLVFDYWLNRDVRVVQFDDKVFSGEYRGRRFEIPTELFNSDYEHGVDHTRALNILPLEGELLVFSIGSPLRGAVIYCVDANGKLVWKNRARVMFATLFGSGPPPLHFEELIHGRESVVLFGVQKGRLYVNVFDQLDGERLLQFSNDWRVTH